MAGIGPLKVVTYASTSQARTERQTRRILLPPAVFKTSKLAAGDTLVIIPALSPDAFRDRLALERVQGTVVEREFAVGRAWPSPTLDGGTVSAHPTLLQGVADADDLVLLSPLATSGLDVQTATEVRVAWADQPESKPKEEAYVLAYIKQVLCDLEYAKPSDTLGIQHTGQRIELRLRCRAAKRADLFRIDTSTTVTFDDAPSRAGPNGIVETGSPIPERPTTTYDAIGGLESQIQQIRELVELPFTSPEAFAHFGLPLPRGLLLHGPPGTGKTMLASAVASSLDIPLFVIDGPSLSSPFHGETEQRLRDVFATAASSAQGGIIVIDEIDALAPKREESGEVERRVVATLLTLMDGVGTKQTSTGASHVMVIAATNRPNALDPALRRPGRFDRELEIGVPNADARRSILAVLLRNTPCDMSADAIANLADRAHGFVGADLAALVRTAALNGIRRSLTTSVPVQQIRLGPHDFEAALLVTRPSAMREVLVETPRVQWTDVGGLDEVKQRLRESVEWPLQFPDSFKRLGIRPPTGVLLYGPPGCSKTLMARALATEAKLNFIAIKGPEVFNKFVGESEKMIREIFRKARLAAPSILFIDELDAIASGRDSYDSSHTGNSVLTTLLTEMDGVDELVGVTVLAATNRPYAIDTALLRPGRLDHLIYLGPPDLEARIAIFDVHLARMAIEDSVSASELARLTEGRSGAEIASICQNAAMQAMHQDRNALQVKREHFIAAAASIRRRITPQMLRDFEAWHEASDTV